ncbi:MAG: glucosidase [Myxococcota bacterium]
MSGAEFRRLEEDKAGIKKWKSWGPYLSERQWGTVREDYSAHGTAWDYLPHEMARKRAYRWGEDGIAGVSDDWQHFCVSLGLWNERDAILKERLFGLTNSEGNHGEDVKELYYYLDATPTHSYMRMLYKYPQARFPYTELVRENGSRRKDQLEYELLDTGVFDEDRYFDVFVEYARADHDDWLMMVTVHNRGPEEAVIHVLPQFVYRNIWSWSEPENRPEIRARDRRTLEAQHRRDGRLFVYGETSEAAWLTQNETNPSTAFGLSEEPGYFKDAFHRHLVEGREGVLNPHGIGTKAAFHHRFSIPPGQSRMVRVRWSRRELDRPFHDFDQVMRARLDEADEFYRDVQGDCAGDDAKLVQRQAFAGMIWSKQLFHYDVEQWLHGDPAQPPPPEERKHGRNREWEHLNNQDVISMPDKWEYPWYAAWDLAFHCVPLAQVDPEFAKHQLDLMTREWYMHPNGQLPAYEWAFSDVNPPVHAWATWRVYRMDYKQTGKKDTQFLERVFHKMMLNFTWWVNRKDADGNNIFQGGFLGLDNIGVFDRSAPLPTGGYIEQSDGTSWMAMYSLNLMRIALELAQSNPVYEDIATKFFEHFLHIASAMTNIASSGIGLWDEHDGFYYDVLHMPHGDRHVMRVRSMVGLIPLYAVEVLDSELLDRVPGFKERLMWVMKNKPGLASQVSRFTEPGRGSRRLLSLLRGHRMRCLLHRMLDETEFLSDYGVRALSKIHEHQPYVFMAEGVRMEVSYVPAESNTELFGGNSNWRGPIWFPVNYMLIESLRRFYDYYGDGFLVECPSGSGHMLTLTQVADELARRLTRLFLKDERGRRPCLEVHEKAATDPHFRDHVLFNEYFHGDTGRGVGASHQTGWTGLVASLLSPEAQKL